MSELVLKVKGLEVAFDGNQSRKTVVDQVSFEVKQGEVLGILGESGSGKTMSTQSVLGLIEGDPGVMGGDILFVDQHGKDHQLLQSLSAFISGDQKANRAWQKHTFKEMKQLWGHGITAIFQNPKKSLDPLMKVGEQVKEALIAKDQRLAQDQAQHHSKQAKQATKSDEQYRKEVIEILQKVQLREPQRVYLSYPHELSGGMCQRIMIAIALACEPRLLIADEPTTGLDATVRAEVLLLLKKLVVDQGNAMLYISHDIREILYLTQNVIVMRYGQIIERAKTEDLINGIGQRHPYTQTLLVASGLAEDLKPKSTQAMVNDHAIHDLHKTEEVLNSVQTASDITAPVAQSIDTQQSMNVSKALVLTAKGLYKAFKVGSHQTIALDQVDLDIYHGEVVALIGESGSGKTTLGKAILRLLSLDAGTVTFEGQDLLALDSKGLREYRKSFQMIFQNQQANLHPKMSVFEMLDESIVLHQPALTIESRKVQIKQLLNQVGLFQHEHRFVASLSGGEQRRVGLARILATKPKLIVADEPTSGLDAAIKLQIIDLLASLKREDLSYLLISHDLGLVKKIADRMIVMLRGRMIEEIPMEALNRYPHHPYTERLLASTELDAQLSEAKGGSVEESTQGVGCVYANTCPLAREKNILHSCSTQRPVLKAHHYGSKLACFGRED